MNYETLGLEGNPFRLTPPLDPKDIIWAGMKEVKSKLEKRIQIALATQPSKIIINWGSYGSGKTHAALYFSKTNRLEELTTKNKKAKAKSIKITLPRASNNIVQEFLRSFLGQYSLEEIYNDFIEIEKDLSKDKLITMIDTFSNDTIIADVFKNLLDADEDEHFIKLKNYIYGDSAKSTLNYLELPYGLTNDEQIANFLATIINCITFEKKHYSSFFIWLDEFEDIDTINKNLQDRFTTFMRQFIDKTPNNFTFFINLTEKAFMDISDLSMYLGEALMSRAKTQIDFERPSIDEAKEYVQELFKSTLTAGKNVPIDDNTIEYILTNIGNLTARSINESFSIILEMALFENKDIIDKAFIDEIRDEIISWDE